MSELPQQVELTPDGKLEIIQDAVAKPRPYTALIGLLCVCVFWGATFPLMKNAMDAMKLHVPSHVVFTIPVLFLLLRFVGAGVLLPLLLIGRRNLKLSRRALKYSWWLAVVFVGSFYLQVYGLRDVEPSVSAFATSLYVVFTPFVVWLFMKKKPSLRVVIATVLALIGVSIIAYRGDVGIAGLISNAGFLLSAACGVGFAIHIVLTDHVTRREDPTLLSALMMGFSMLLAFATMLLFAFLPLGDSLVPAGDWMSTLPAMLSDWDVIWPLGITTIFATVFAVWFWNKYQKDIGPSRAAVLYTMEPVFSTIISIAMLHEEMHLLLGIGGGLIIATNLWLQLGEPSD